MKNVLLFAVFVFATRAAAQISLTPTVSERMQEGFPFPQLQFADGGKKVTYEQPRGWTYSSEGKQKIAFYPPHTSQTKADIQAGYPVVPSQFDEEGLKQLKALFLTLLPKDCQQVEIVAEQKNPVLINGHDTYEFTASLLNHGQKYRMSVLFVNLEHEQLRCSVIAESNNFEEVHRAFIASLFGLQWSP